MPDPINNPHAVPQPRPSDAAACSALSDTPESDEARNQYQRELWSGLRKAPHTPTMVPLEFAQKLERQRNRYRTALIAAMANPIPHAVGCSHRDETCTCHRGVILRAFDEPNANNGGTP